MRAFFFLLLSIQCVPDDLGSATATLEYDAPYRLVRIARPNVKRMKTTRIDDVTIYTRYQKVENEFVTGRYLDIFVRYAGAWYQLKTKDPEASPVIEWTSHSFAEADRFPVIARAKRGSPILRVTWVEQWSKGGGVTRHTVLLDFRAKPRVLLSLDCYSTHARGACSAARAAHDTQHQLTCDDDLRCEMRELVYLDWARRAATRRFDLLTKERFAPSRFDAVTYGSGAAFAAAAPGSIRQRALIDGIGLMYPVFEVSPGKVIFAAHPKEPIAGFRFFLLAGNTWREIPLTLLTDAGYPGDPAIERAGTIGKDFTPDAPQPVFSAWDLEFRGKFRIIEVLAIEGTARTLHWIALDPSGRTEALRLATNKPEWRECGNDVYPVNANFVGIPDSGFPARVTAIASWRWWELKDNQVPRTCELTGTIDWSAKRGWIVRLGQSPCTDPIARPFAVIVNDYGDFWVETVKFSQ